MEMWKISFQTLSAKTKGDQTQQDLDQCNNKVQETSRSTTKGAADECGVAGKIKSTTR